MRLALFAAASAAFLSACNPTLRSHGYVATDVKPAEVLVGEDSRDTVYRQLGSPSTTAVFGDEIWYYISSSREELAFYEARTRSRSIVAISFGEDGTVAGIEEFDLEDGRTIRLVGRETPTRGRELSVLEQLFGNIGRLPTEQFGGERDLPGGAGGPRPGG